jgi:hypothetical protein
MGCNAYNLKFRASAVKSILADARSNRAILVLELDMGQRAESWKIIRQLISDRSDQAGTLAEENVRLKAENAELRKASTPVVDNADAAADAEMNALAAAVTANKLKASEGVTAPAGSVPAESVEGM